MARSSTRLETFADAGVREGTVPEPAFGVAGRRCGYGVVR